ncbi:DUF4823 domain-containing protein [Methylophaga sp.]|uniref:DUF4823 domain-containing protein n=1 Tax=Methylophaga sp. TaxID=2024840 RepID=UPI003A943EC9
MKTLTFIFLSLFLCSCADTAKITPDIAYKSVTLDKSHSVYISLPEDGVYGDKVYNGSGATVSAIVRAAFLKHLVQVESSTQSENYRDSLKSAKQNKANYLVYVSILHWEDRATEWSGIPDRADIKMTIASTHDDSIISSVTIRGKSGLATFGGDHPQDLLPEPVNNYVDSLFYK